jgi:hypothetical protein
VVDVPKIVRENEESQRSSIMKNGKPIDLETRLERLEADVKAIKALLEAQQKPEEPWWKSVVGSFANDPVGQEIIELGLQVREKDREKARRRFAKKKSRA